MRHASMRYHPGLDRWSVNCGDTIYGLHCGESIELLLDGRPYACRLEFAETWYVIVGNVGLALRPKEVYEVRI